MNVSMKRWLILSLTALFSLAALLTIDQYYRALVRRQNTHQLAQAGDDVKYHLKEGIRTHILAVEDLKAYLLASPAFPDWESFDRYTAQLLIHYPELRVLQYVDSEHIIRYIYPLQGNEDALGLDLMNQPAAPFVEKAMHTRQTILNHPTVTVQGSLSIVARAPLFRGDQYLGLAQGVFDITTLLETGSGLDPAHFNLVLSDATGETFWETGVLVGEPYQDTVQVGDYSWELTLGWAQTEPQPDLFILSLIWGLGGALLTSVLFALHQTFVRLAYLDAVVQEKTVELVRSQARYRQLFDKSHDAVFLLDSQGAILDANQTAIERYGFSLQEFKNMQASDLAAPEVADQVPSRLRQILEKEMQFEWAHRRKDGSLFPVEIGARPMVMEGQSRVLSTVRDITERKRAEGELHRSEARFGAVASHTPDHIVMQDCQLRYTYVLNPQLGLAEDEMLGKTDYDLLSEAEAERLTLVKTQVMDTGEPHYFATSLVAKSGEEAFFEGTYVPTYDSQGHVSGLIGYFRNVTTNRQAQARTLKINRALEVFRASNHALIRVSEEDALLQEICKNVVEIAGYKLAWVGFQVGEKCVPVAQYGADEVYLRSLMIDLSEGDFPRGPITATFATKKTNVIQSLQDDPRFIPWRDQAVQQGYTAAIFLPMATHDQVLGTLNIFSDQKNAFDVDEVALLEELADDLTYGLEVMRIKHALQKSEERFRRALENIPDVVVIYDRDLRIQYINEATRNITGRPASDFIGHREEEIWPPGVYQSYLPTLITARETGEIQSIDTELFLPEGGLRALRITCVPLLDPDGQVREVVGITHDFTVQKQIENDLRESEYRYRQLLEVAPIGVAVHTQGRIVFTNQAGAQLLGAETPEALIGKSITEIIHPDGLQAARDRIQRMFAGEVGLYPTDDRYVRLDGTVIPVEVLAVPLTYQGKPAVQVMVTDITGRKQAEESLLRSREQMRELAHYLQQAIENERKFIAREIHDELGQRLTALKIELLKLGEGLPDERLDLAQQLARMSMDIDKTIDNVRSLSSQLRPGVLDDLGLIAAVEWLVNDFSKRTGIPCHLTLPEIDPDLSQGIATDAFRICQESLTNVTRHARATQVWVDLAVDAECLRLLVRDNGRGISSDDFPQHKSLGLLGMRERARNWNGEIEISGQPGVGTWVRLRIPLSPAR